MKKSIYLSLTSIFLLNQGGFTLAADKNAFSLFEEEAKVITASRRSESIREAPVAVEVITAEDIRNSGAVNLWDFMRFRAGMDVTDARSGEGNRAIVSVRGFPAEFVDKLLVLVDGRSVYTGLSGGAVWEHIPVQVPDIDRIEIVRGPNAALYGSNSGLGVINIITKKPRDVRTLSSDVLVGNRGLHREQAAFENTGDRAGYRVSFAHKAVDGNPLAATGFEGNDFLNSNKGNFRGFWNPTPRSKFELFTGGSWQTTGVVDVDNPQGRFRNHFQMLKYAYDLHPRSSIQMLAARRDDVRTFDALFSGVLTVREYQYDAELTHQFDWGDNRMHSIYGASFRYTGIDSEGIFRGRSKQKNGIQRGFGNQSWRILPRLDLIGALSVERSDTGGTQPAYQVAGVYSPLDNHAFRASYGLAPTIPTLYQKAANQQATSLVLLVGNPNLKPQKLHSYELSYQGSSPKKSMLWETNFFYMDISDLSQTIVQSFEFVPVPLLTLSFDNENSAVARGTELKWSYRWNGRNSIYTNYTYESISDQKGNTNVQKGTPRHKFNFGGVVGHSSGISLSMNAGYKGGHALYSQATSQILDIHPYWRLDARLAYALPTRKDVELYISGQNLLTPQHVEFAEGLSVPRTYQCGVSGKF